MNDGEDTPNSLGYSVSYSNYSNNTFDGLTSGTITVTNTKRVVTLDVSIIKIDEETRNIDTQTKLTGAKFRLFKHNGNEYIAYDDVYGGEDGVEVGNSGENKGTLTFNSLSDGEYMIVEISVPDGYVKAANNDIYLKIDDGVVKRYDKPVGATDRTEISSKIDGTDIDNVVSSISFVLDQDHSKCTFTVGNTPGATLPMTGGSGTLLYKLLGWFMVLLSLTRLYIKYKKEVN